MRLACASVGRVARGDEDRQQKQKGAGWGRLRVALGRVVAPAGRAKDALLAQAGTTVTDVVALGAVASDLEREAVLAGARDEAGRGAAGRRVTGRGRERHGVQHWGTGRQPSPHAGSCSGSSSSGLEWGGGQLGNWAAGELEAQVEGRRHGHECLARGLNRRTVIGGAIEVPRPPHWTGLAGLSGLSGLSGHVSRAWSSSDGRAGRC
jgi:hypothetical protein